MKIGYTHYWTITSSIKENFEAFAKDCKEVIDYEIKNGTKLQFEHNIEDLPKTDTTMVRFNGVGEEGHETFLIASNSSQFDFCKTARKPYDTAVTACLLLAKYHFKEAIKISSDGGDSGFNRAFLVLSRIFPERKFDKLQTTHNWYD